VVLSLNRTFEVLLSFGLSQTEARVYIHLATKGPAKAKNIIDELTINKQQLYRCLKKLRKRRIINFSGFPAIFQAEPVEQVLTMLMSKKQEEAKLVEEKKTELLYTWKTIEIKKKDKDC
jgi:sugar-specific transcriptional regulator TrmB